MASERVDCFCVDVPKRDAAHEEESLGAGETCYIGRGEVTIEKLVSVLVLPLSRSAGG